MPLPQDAVYPQATTDDTGTALSCANTYTIHFNQVNGVAQTPPNNGFWSITAYNSAGLFIDNVLNRYDVGGATGLTPNADGSIDIVLQSDPSRPRCLSVIGCPAAPPRSTSRCAFTRPPRAF